MKCLYLGSEITYTDHYHWFWANYGNAMYTQRSKDLPLISVDWSELYQLTSQLHAGKRKLSWTDHITV